MSPYPNPTSGSLRVDWISADDSPIQLQVFDPLGKLVFQSEVAASQGFNSASLDLVGLTQGLYYLTFNSGETKRSMRFAIHR
jgi:hypothetical protein